MASNELETTLTNAKNKITGAFNKLGLKKKLTNVREEFVGISNTITDAILTTPHEIYNEKLGPKEDPFILQINELNAKLSADLNSCSRGVIDRLNVDWCRVKNYALEELKELEKVSSKVNELGRDHLEINDKLDQLKLNFSLLPNIDIDYCVSLIDK